MITNENFFPTTSTVSNPFPINSDLIKTSFDCSEVFRRADWVNNEIESENIAQLGFVISSYRSAASDRTVGFKQFGNEWVCCLLLSILIFIAASTPIDLSVTINYELFSESPMEIIDLMSRSWFFHCSSWKIHCDGSKCNREGLIGVDWVIELQHMHFDSCWSYSRLSSILRMSIQLSEKLICFFTISCSRVGGVQKKHEKIDGNHKNFIFHISINSYVQTRFKH